LPAEDGYRTAIAVAKEQTARSYELIASLALAKLYRSTGRLVEAHDVLAPALAGFAPTPEMPEIEEAQALVNALAQAQKAKDAAAACWDATLLAASRACFRNARTWRPPAVPEPGEGQESAGYFLFVRPFGNFPFLREAVMSRSQLCTSQSGRLSREPHRVLRQTDGCLFGRVHFDQPG
jgi:hypothetical protein